MKRSAPLRRSQPIARADHKLYRCKAPGCPASFLRMRPMQEVCSAECAITLTGWRNRRAEEKRKADAHREYREARERQKKLSDLADDAQKEVNRYVRLRDHAEGCISCSKPLTWGGQWHAGHMRSRGASPATRFIVWAIRKQCSECNHKKSGNAAEMYRRLLEIVGQEKMDWLYAQNTTAKFSREYLIRLKSVFRKKANRQEKRNALHY